MPANTNIEKKEKESITLLDQAGEMFECLQIVVASTITGIIIGSAIYFSNPGKSRLTISIIILVISILAGIILAIKWKKGKINKLK